MLIRFLFRLLSRCELRTLHRLGEMVAAIIWITHGKRRGVALRNIERCFPELSAAEHERMARAAIAHEMKTITELPLLWLGPEARMRACLREVRGLDLVERVLARGQGMLMLTLHMGSFEGPAIPYSADWAITGLYKPQKGVINDLAYQGRSRMKGKLLPAEGGVRRSMVPLLKANEQVYFLPDQDPPPGRGVFVPFFGHLAHTPTLVAKVLQETDAEVVYMFGERLPRGQGYIMHFLPASPALRDPDIEKSAAAMNRDLEAIIRRKPEQYWWGYRRFRRQPEGADDFYAGV